MYDIIVIGGGVVGCAIARELSQYKLQVALLEAADDVANGASRANSGIVHGGYDCEIGTLKARFNVLGNKLYHELAKELHVPFKCVGSLVLGDKNGLDKLKELKKRGDANGVETTIIGRDEILKIEPNVADDITCALLCKSAAIVSPYKMTIALADYAVLNGVEIKVNNKVTAIDKSGDVFTVKTTAGVYQTHVVINAAGGYASEINALLGAEDYKTTYARGEYFLLDKTENVNINTVLFPLPDEKGKGILVAPTADGNVIYGPTSINTNTPLDTGCTLDGLKYIRQTLSRIYKIPHFNKTIRLYAGVRAISGHDFIIEKSRKVDGLIMLVGICSPGLTAAPAIAKYVLELANSFVKLEKKDNLVPLLKHERFTEMSQNEINEHVNVDSKWGRIICRCETVTEAEIVNAIHSPLQATTVDAVKRRTRAGMGRCQGGFCAPKVMEIISRELNIPITQVKKGGEGSNIAVCEIKADSYEL